MPLKEVLDYLNSFDDPYLRAIHDETGQTWGIETVRRMLEVLGSPHQDYPIIHIAGTKGKGSTAALITQGLIESGLKVGLYTSPHLEDWRERIQINRELISVDALEKLVEDVKPYAEQFPMLSAFEIVTVLALWHFAREDCDAAVIEVGLGGRLDATSVVEPTLAVITNISYDHMQLLGNTLAEIAAEKAAIIKPGIPVISAPQKDEALQVISAYASQQNAPLTVIGRDISVTLTGQSWEGVEIEIDGKDRYQVGLAGQFQAENAAVAITALKSAQARGIAITEQGIKQGMEKAEWPGRLELVAEKPRIILDSAHNAHSIQRAAHSIRQLTDQKPVIAVFGCMADKDINGMLQAILPICKSLILTQADHYRAAESDKIKKMANENHKTIIQSNTIQITSTTTVEDGIKLALAEASERDTILVIGSLSIAGAARTYLKNMEF